ncbi:hypothetical protein B0H10DRAFT_2054653 [Mycena sp. CBHHK59/15]|nr:hypothetical protein B0H10DRAFT_2054653 [Mycena sp. CBHHK59/15]
MALSPPANLSAVAWHVPHPPSSSCLRPAPSACPRHPRLSRHCRLPCTRTRTQLRSHACVCGFASAWDKAGRVWEGGWRRRAGDRPCDWAGRRWTTPPSVSCSPAPVASTNTRRRKRDATPLRCLHSQPRAKPISASRQPRNAQCWLVDAPLLHSQARCRRSRCCDIARRNTPPRPRHLCPHLCPRYADPLRYPFAHIVISHPLRRSPLTPTATPSNVSSRAGSTHHGNPVLLCLRGYLYGWRE